jgi:hypothetical protein
VAGESGPVVEVQVDPPGAYQEARIIIGCDDALASTFQAEVVVNLGEIGRGTVTLDTSGWFKPAIHFIQLIRAENQEFGPSPSVFFEARRPHEQPRSDAELKERIQELENIREAFYKQPLGDPQAPEARRFQGVMLVERLLMTSLVRLPNTEIRPTGKGNPAESESKLFDEIMNGLLGTAKPLVSASEWSKRSENSRPIWTAPGSGDRLGL